MSGSVSSPASPAPSPLPEPPAPAESPSPVPSPLPSGCPGPVGVWSVSTVPCSPSLPLCNSYLLIAFLKNNPFIKSSSSL